MDFFSSLFRDVFFLGEDIGSPSSSSSPSFSDVGSLFFGKKAKEKKKKVKKSTHAKEKTRDYCAHSLFLSLSLRFARYKIHAHARTRTRDARRVKVTFSSSFEELSEVKKKNALGR